MSKFGKRGSYFVATKNERNKKNVIESQLFVQYFQGNDEIIIYILKSKLLFRIHLAEAACSCCYK